jgi:hypothetical protein
MILIGNTLLNTMYLYSYESSSTVFCFYLHCGHPRSEARLPFYIQPTSKPTPYRISVSAHKSSHPGRALIDQGANGGIAGNDVCIISTTGRTVNVTGIDNHQLCSIKIGTVGAYADTQRGPAILIMHQYAIHQAH